MRGIGIAQIILLVLFVVVPIINYFLSRKERQRQARMESRRTPTAQPPPDAPIYRPAAPHFTPPTEPAYPRSSAPPPMPRTRPRRGWSRQTLFRSKRDLRRTIVAMTILGPCRADDPPN